VEVLERGPLPTRFFLSSKACRGILRRAGERGRDLPQALKQALEAQAAKGAGTLDLGPEEMEGLSDLLEDEPRSGETTPLGL